MEIVKWREPTGGNSKHYYDRRKNQIKREMAEKTNVIDIELDFKPKKGQKAIISAVNRDCFKKIVVNVFRQYGKSFVCRYLALVWMETPDTVVGYITQTGRLAKDIYKKFINMFPPELVKAKDGKDLIIELVNGSKLIFFSVEQTHSIRGFTLDYLIWDEVSHSREYTPDGEHIYYNIVAPLLDAKGKKEVYISTPNGAQGFFYEEAMKGLNRQKGYCYIKIGVEDDETKTPQWIEEKKQGFPLNAWLQEYECQFLEGGLSFFTNYQGRFVYDTFDWNGKLWAGVDFSSSGTDDTVLTFVNSKGQAIQYIIEGDLDSKYRQISGHLNKQAGKLVKCYLERNSIGEVMGNEIMKLLTSSVKRATEFIVTSNSSKADYIEKLALDIEQEKIGFMEDNETLRDEFAVFICKVTKTGKKSYAALEGMHDDCVISLALANLAKHKTETKSGADIMVVRT